jgi:hypothetical protein
MRKVFRITRVIAGIDVNMRKLLARADARVARSTASASGAVAWATWAEKTNRRRNWGRWSSSVRQPVVEQHGLRGNRGATYSGRRIMAIKGPETWARIKSNTFLFADIAQQSYLEYLDLEDRLKVIDTEDVPVDHEPIHRRDVVSVQTILFAAMAFEAAIYDYAALHLGDQYVQDHLDKLDVLSKWILCLRLIADYEIPKDRVPYAALKRLVQARNRLVHSKSEPFGGANIQAQFERIKVESERHWEDVHNAFRALVLMAFELERVIGIGKCPIPTFDTAYVPMLQIPEPLKPIVADCRRIVLAQDSR